MHKDSLEPFALMAVAMAFGAACALYVTATERVAHHHKGDRLEGPTFEQRWAPIEPFEGKALDPSIWQQPLRLDRAHDIAPGPECHWARCKLT